MKVDIEHTAKGWAMRCTEGSRVIASSSGKTPKEAARWLVHQLNRVTDAAEGFLIESGFLTEDEVAQAAEGIVTVQEIAS